MAAADGVAMQRWGKLSDAPLESTDFYDDDERQKVTIRFVNASSSLISVNWVDTAGRIRPGAPIHPAAGPLHIADGSVSSEQTQTSVAGHAFAMYDGGAVYEANGALAEARAAGAVRFAIWYVATVETEARVRVVTIRDGPTPRWLRWFGSPGLVASHGAGDVPRAPARVREYAYARVVVAGLRVDLDERIDPGGGDARALLEDVAAAAARLPAAAVAALGEGGSRVVAHAETAGFGSMCFHPRGGGDWLEEHGFDRALAGCVHIYRLADYFGDRDLWGAGGSLVHELAHAYHDLALRDGHANAAVARRYANAVGRDRLYDAVFVKGPQAAPKTGLERAGHTACACRRNARGFRRRHYATTNAAEFFAELSTAYCATDAADDYNKWEPFNRPQLEARDPETAALLRRVWVDGDALDGDDDGDDDPPPPRRQLLCCRSFPFPFP